MSDEITLRKPLGYCVTDWKVKTPQRDDPLSQVHLGPNGLCGEMSVENWELASNQVEDIIEVEMETREVYFRLRVPFM